jgi:CDP-glucose 4,6-dehydratase
MEDLEINPILKQFKNKKVFITGHTGFKGAWFSQLLLQVGAIVKGFSLPPNTEPSLFHLLGHHQKFESVFANINHFEEIENHILSFQPDVIFHLAAQPLVRYSYHHTIETFQTNVLGTANLLEACKKLNKSCAVVCITTDKVYRNKEEHYAYNELDSLGGHDPYSASKAAAELVIDSYRKSFFYDGQIQVASARAGNVIGGGDWSEDRLIPDLVRSISLKQKMKMRNPFAVRPWQHVLDPIMGYMTLATKMMDVPHTYTSAWNFGPTNGEEKTVSEVANIFYRTFGMEAEIDIEPDQILHEANLLMLDISKSQKQLLWDPKWNTERAIKETALWYSELDSSNAEQITNLNIYSFFSNEL